MIKKEPREEKRTEKKRTPLLVKSSVEKVKGMDFFDNFIGAKLERVYFTRNLGITLCFNTNEVLTLEAVLDSSQYGIVPLLMRSKGHWCLVEADPIAS